MSLIHRKHREKMQKFAHILAAIIILLHAFEKFEINEPSYPFYTIAGIIFLLIAIFHDQVARRFSYIDSTFMIIEAAVYGMIANEYFHAGKKGLPWLYVIAVAVYVAAALINSRKSRKKHRGKKRKSKSTEDMETPAA
ncbi:hypothetical protein BH20BAC1_BH20BAC1_18820 [soil metagenome]